MKTELELYIESFMPPGMELWCDTNRQFFIDAHGPDDYEPFMLSAAWTLYRRIYRNPEMNGM